MPLRPQIEDDLCDITEGKYLGVTFNQVDGMWRTMYDGINLEGEWSDRTKARDALLSVVSTAQGVKPESLSNLLNKG